MGGKGDIADPEAARIDELIDRAERGGVSEAESEELALYVAENPALSARIETADRRRDLGGGWLERVRKDEAIQKAETDGRTRLERGGGLGLAALGFLLQFVNPFVGVAVLGSGIALLLYSFIRVRAKQHKDDPYKDVQR
jgi:hypothetical protein